MFLLLIGIFLAGIALVALEDRVGIDKTASALLMSVVLWVIVALSGTVTDITQPFTDHLGDVADTLFFVMGSMVIVQLIDVHGGFRGITDRIRTTRKRKMLWITGFLTFFLSALLDDLATGIVMIALLRKFIPDQKDRLVYACMTIIAANAGGSWTPIGDVTTILLWTGGNLTPLHQIGHLFLPALVSMIVPLCIATRFFKRGEDWSATPAPQKVTLSPAAGRKSRIVILLLGVGTMALVPMFNEWTGLPPFMFLMFGLPLLWIYTDVLYKRSKEAAGAGRVTEVLSRIDMSTILYFLGILMSVAALDTSGQLQKASHFLSGEIHNPLGLGFVIGMVSSFVDNVALVAATMSMYPVDPSSLDFMANGQFWTFLAYCAVTGGSLLIIGSATGVTVMGMEKISFMYYFKRFSLIALAGYAAGALTYLLLF